jgi:hypothetical protein
LIFLQGHEELLFYEAAVPLLKEKRRHEGFVHEEREDVEGGLGSGSDGGEGGFWRRERPEGLF